MIFHLAAPKFHGIPWNITWNSMELSDISFGGTKVPWNSMEYSMEFHGNKLYFIWRHQSSMEFHGLFHGIPWNTCVIWNGALLIPWNPMELGDFYLATQEFYGIPWNIPCKSRVTWYWIKWQSQSSMEFHGTKWYFIWRHPSSMDYSMEFPGTKLYFIWRHQGSMEFHGISHGSPG